MSAATPARFPVGAPEPDSAENEVLDLYDASQKLIVAAKEEENKRKEGELELARSFAKEIHGATIDVERIVQRNDAWRAEDERASLRIAALTNVRSKVDKLLAKHKAENAKAVKNALTSKLDKLNKDLAQQTGAATGLQEDIKRIEEEIAKLTKPYAGTTAAVAPVASKKKKKR